MYKVSSQVSNINSEEFCKRKLKIHTTQPNEGKNQSFEIEAKGTRHMTHASMPLHVPKIRNKNILIPICYF